MTHSTTDTPDSPLTRLLLQAERAVLYTLGFHLDVAHPYFSVSRHGNTGEPAACRWRNNGMECVACARCTSGRRHFTSYLIHTIPWMATPTR